MATNYTFLAEAAEHLRSASVGPADGLLYLHDENGGIFGVLLTTDRFNRLTEDISFKQVEQFGHDHLEPFPDYPKVGD